MTHLEGIKDEVKEDIPESTVIIISVVCTLVVLALLIVLIVLWVRKKKMEKKLAYEKQGDRPKPQSAPPPIIASSPPQFDNLAMDTRDGLEMDDPTPGGIYGASYDSEPPINIVAPRQANGNPPAYNDWAKLNGHKGPPSYTTEAYEMENQANCLDEDEKKYPHMSTSGYHGHSFDQYGYPPPPMKATIQRVPSDSSAYSQHSRQPENFSQAPYYPAGLAKEGSSRSGENGYSTPDAKPKKVIYEVIV